MKNIQQIWAENIQLLHLNIRSTVEEVEDAFRKAGLWEAYHYAKDEHFEFVLREINTLKKAQDFIKQLNKERMDLEKNGRGWGNGKTYTCQKTWGLESWLKKKFWQKKDYICVPFSVHRRTCCGCHESGSFALRKPWP